ncbi:hypothetical protein PI95_031800 [Hassallia byssoidea VB512170]|uniref:Uncharacterized protein n=1 Tax=Hassallia byssoidea VB512170 TaxID=1304833 RepID=A0A846HJB5_9CYAN|nr:hypothetical protein [Hassalia byssoidea]NEU76959.1 hypothetical protein [Hassalia byssoidea VB512170]
MQTPQVVTELKRLVLLARIWFWAAVRSPYFRECQLSFDHPPIEVDVRWSKYSCEFLLIQISFHRPKLALDIPWTICLDFIEARRKEGEIIEEKLIDNIPF